MNFFIEIIYISFNKELILSLSYINLIILNFNSSLILLTDIDECNNGLSNCGISEQCINFKGGYRCSPVCPPGFQLSNDSHFSNEESCQDINECALGLHSCNVLTQFCLNTNGSYTCEVFTTTTSSTIINRPLSIKKNHIMQVLIYLLFLCFIINIIIN